MRTNQGGTAEHGRANRHSGRDEEKTIHALRPPRTAEDRAQHLRRPAHRLEDGGDRAVRRFIRHQVEPGSNDPVGVAIGGDAIRPSGTTGAASASRASRSALVA
jgi:hypothetical protein